MAQAQSPGQDDIVELITDNARKNFNKVIGLPCFVEAVSQALCTNSSVTRRQKETLTELYIRIEGIVEQLESFKPTGKEVQVIFVSIIINALPKDFAYILTETDMKIPLTVYKKALRYVASHPSPQLTDVAISREMSKGIPVNSITSQETPVYQIPIGRNKTYCQRCGLINHDTQHCRASDVIDQVIFLGSDSSMVVIGAVNGKSGHVFI